MGDLRDTLRRYAEAAGQAPDLDAILHLRTRRHRWRRAGGLVVGIGFASVPVIAGILILTSRPASDGRSEPIGASGGTAPRPPTIPYLWPENWASADAADDIRDLESRLGGGDAGVQWRLDPEAVVERFAQQVLGWPEIAVSGQQSAPTTQWWEISPACSAGGCDPTWRETVRVDRLPSSQAWVVTSVEAGGLSTGLEHGYEAVAVDLLPATIRGAHGIDVTLSGYSGPLGTIGLVTYDGCSVERTVRSSLSPGTYSLTADPPPATPGCSSTSVGFVFAYTSPGSADELVPGSGAIDFVSPGLTLVPVVVPAA